MSRFWEGDRTPNDFGPPERRSVPVEWDGSLDDEIKWAEVEETLKQAMQLKAPF
jgi:hypothetical protein